MKVLAWILVASIVLAPGRLQGQADSKPTCPDSAATQFDMHVCANERYIRRRVLLDQLVREVRASLQPDGGEFDRRPLLDTAQVAWVAYAKAQCDFAASEYYGGTMLPTVALDCLSAQTTGRLRELAPLLCDDSMESDTCPAADQYLRELGQDK
jgi:uncharacterized protein YecT (DUF1311 family)